MTVLPNPSIQPVDQSTIGKRSLTGVTSLISRSFIIQVISLLATFLLTVLLDPKIFGIFYLVSAVVNFFTYFSDIGLAAALIQKKEELSEIDLKTTFLVQNILVLILLVTLYATSPLVVNLYHLDVSSQQLLYALGISFFLSSLKTIPSVILERSLRFNLLVIPQILENLVFNIVVVFLAWRGLGITSFTYAILVRGVVGLVAVYLICPWRPGWSFSLLSLKQLLRFGVPYQANTIIAVLKDDLMTVFLGRLIGTTGLGYLGWAKKWAEMPLRFFMDNVLKVTFPAFSRMQNDPVSLKKSIEKSLFFLSFLTFPVLMGFSYLASDLVKIIPRYLKWQPALIPLYLYCINSAWATISTTMTNLLNATGQIKTTFKLMLMWLGLTWLLMPYLGWKYGYLGVAVAAVIISFSSITPIIIAQKRIKFNLFASIGKPILASVLMILTLLALKPLHLVSKETIILRGVIGICSYLFFSYILIGDELFKDIHQFVAAIKNRT